MVYVDNATRKYGRMKMAHMAADSTYELLAMAHQIGVARKWLQHTGTYREHFDVCKAKRLLAIRYGALEVPSRFIVDLMRKKKL
jgi:hypothetical protein